MSKVIEYRASGLVLDVHPNFVDPEIEWYEHIHRHLTFDPKRRSTFLFGDPGIIYRVKYRNYSSENEVNPWKELLGLSTLKRKVEAKTNQKYTVCAMQYYAHGGIGIQPHQDKEMVLGTTIAGVSFGQERTLQMLRGPAKIDVTLPHGSLYVMYPPTNQRWFHSIVKDKSKGGRISLTFRSYIPE